jgi:SAM-dependent methyltransferase
MAVKQAQHGVLPEASHDEAARQSFVFGFSKHVLSSVVPGNQATYDKRVAPGFKKLEGRDPRDRHELRHAMARDGQYQVSSALQRTTQEMLWDSVGESIERQWDTLCNKAHDMTAGKTRGTLRLDPAMKMPGYIDQNDHHAMPGGYSADLADGDIFSGALYDRGAFIYTDGLLGPHMEGSGLSVVRFLQSQFPDLKPRRILELGCTTGATATVLGRAFPDAEMHAIDVGAALLRYAHARAEALEAGIQFSQQNAEHTDFADGSFDLVVTNAMLHETALQAIHNIMGECHRVLRYGGVMVHAEQPQFEGMDLFKAFTHDWDSYNNNEPFWGTVHDLDLEGLAVEAGFLRAAVFQTFSPGAAASAGTTLHVDVDPKKIMGSDRGGGLKFYFGAMK